MKIIKEVPSLGDVKQRIKFNSHVKSVSELTSGQAARIITPNENTSTFFKEPLNGKAYITYPLSTVVEVEVKNVKQVGELLWLISKVYRDIYDEEDKSTEIDPKAKNKIVCNRITTNGTHGIWGHIIEDLWFESVTIHEDGNITFGIGS